MRNPVFVAQSQRSVASIIAILSHYLLLLLYKGLEGIRKFAIIRMSAGVNKSAD